MKVTFWCSIFLPCKHACNTALSVSPSLFSLTDTHTLSQFELHTNFCCQGEAPYNRTSCEIFIQNDSVTGHACTHKFSLWHLLPHSGYTHCTQTRTHWNLFSHWGRGCDEWKKQNHLLSSFFLCCCIQWENRTVNPTLSPAGTSRGFECVARCLYCHLYVCGQTFQITISHPARCNLKNDNWAVDIKIEFNDGCGLTVLSKDYFNMLRFVKAHRKMISTLVLVQILSLIFMLLHNVLYKLILNTWNTGLCCLPTWKIKKKYPFGSHSTEESMRLFTLTWMSWLIIPTLLRCKTLFILGIQPNCVWWPSPTSRTSQINENKIIYKTTRRKGDK